MTGEKPARILLHFFQCTMSSWINKKFKYLTREVNQMALVDLDKSWTAFVQNQKKYNINRPKSTAEELELDRFE